MNYLTSKRCYKNAMPLEKAHAIIREESGTHFGPVVVEAFSITITFELAFDENCKIKM